MLSPRWPCYARPVPAPTTRSTCPQLAGGHPTSPPNRTTASRTRWRYSTIAKRYVISYMKCFLKLTPRNISRPIQSPLSPQLPVCSAIYILGINKFHFIGTFFSNRLLREEDFNYLESFYYTICVQIKISDALNQSC